MCVFSLFLSLSVISQLKTEKSNSFLHKSIISLKLHLLHGFDRNFKRARSMTATNRRNYCECCALSANICSWFELIFLLLFLTHSRLSCRILFSSYIHIHFIQQLVFFLSVAALTYQCLPLSHSLSAHDKCSKFVCVAVIMITVKFSVIIQSSCD